MLARSELTSEVDAVQMRVSSASRSAVMARSDATSSTSFIWSVVMGVRSVTMCPVAATGRDSRRSPARSSISSQKPL